MPIRIIRILPNPDRNLGSTSVRIKQSCLYRRVQFDYRTKVMIVWRFRGGGGGGGGGEFFPHCNTGSRLSNQSGEIIIITRNVNLTLMLLVANLANTQWGKKMKNETLTHGYSSESESYLMNTDMQGLDGFQESLCLCALGKSSPSIRRVKNYQQYSHMFCLKKSW